MRDPWGHAYQYLNHATAKGKGAFRKDKRIVPINTDYDLYSMGKDGQSVAPLTAKASRDDIVRANDGRFVGLASLTFMTTANALVQTTTEPAMRGRVMALYMAVFAGGTPLGAPIVGAVADAWGPRWAIGVGALSGFVALAIALVWLVRFQHVRLRYDADNRLHLAVTRSLPVVVPAPGSRAARAAVRRDLEHDEAVVERSSPV